jgi:hypothetical protein
VDGNYSERPLCQWFKCFNELPPKRRRFCCDKHAIAYRKHKERRRRLWRDTIASLKPLDHELIKSVVDHASYVAALEEIAKESVREDRRGDNRLVEIVFRTWYGWGRISGPPFVRADVREIFLAEGRRRRRRDASTWLSRTQNDESDGKPVAIKAIVAASGRRRRAEAAYKAAFPQKPPRALSPDFGELPVREVQNPLVEPQVSKRLVEQEKVHG